MMDVGNNGWIELGHGVEQALGCLRPMQLLNRRAAEASHRQRGVWSKPLPLSRYSKKDPD